MTYHPPRLWARLARTLLFAGSLLGLQLAASEDKPEAVDARSATVEALEKFNSVIGEWRGAAQPVRNSTKGAWTETSEWVWELTKESAGIKYTVTGGKQFTSALLSFDPETEQYTLTAELVGGGQRSYRGAFQNQKLTVESDPDAESVHRVTLTLLNDKRMLALFEKRPAEGNRYTREVEVGYTRQGTSLAIDGAGDPECIVSGGKGTMSTVYKGKTYWFCCTGCRDAFNDDPDGIIAEAVVRAAKKKEKAEAAKKKS